MVLCAYDKPLGLDGGLLGLRTAGWLRDPVWACGRSGLGWERVSSIIEMGGVLIA